MPENLPAYLTYKQARLGELRDALSSAQPTPTELSVTARVAGGSGVRPVQVREFTIVTDSSAALAGHDLGPTAPELLLSALASCLAHTFLIAATNEGLTYEMLEVEVRGTIDFRGILEVSTEAPVAPQNITYEARMAVNAGAEQLARLQFEVERLCPVLQALTQPLTVKGRIVRQ
jgi:uncharacterized OsmC-like protein